MTPTEVVRLLRLVKQIAPAQKLDEFTPDAWHTLLGHIPVVDALEAVKAIGMRQAFIAPSDIIAEVRVIRRKRLDHADSTFVYDGDPDDIADYQRRLKAHVTAIANGAEPPSRPPLAVSVPPKAIANTFKTVPKGRTS